jgi:hypothetical protein
MTLETNTMWGSGGLDHMVRLAIPMMIFAGMIMVMRHAARSGLRMFTGPEEVVEVAQPLEQLPEAAAATETEEAPATARPYDGFDPAEIYGAPPAPPSDHEPTHDA